MSWMSCRGSVRSTGTNLTPSAPVACPSGLAADESRHEPTRQPDGKDNRAVKHNIDGLIEQAEPMRTALPVAPEKRNALLAGMKRHRWQNRMVQQTIAQLRTIKELGD